MNVPWSAPAMWKGGECYIIGGGASLLQTFAVPAEIGKAVQQGKEHPSALSPYLAPIHDKHVIGVNSAFLLGPWVDVIFFGDPGWYRENRKALAKVPAIKATCCYDIEDKFPEVEVKWLGRDRSDKAKRHAGLTKTPGYVVWNYHSGGAAINLACSFGVKKIYLIGFDMAVDENGYTHWHSEYRKHHTTNPPRRQAEKGRISRPPYNRFLRSYPQIAKDATSLGVEIVNLNPNSAIKAFPHEAPSWLETT